MKRKLFIIALIFSVLAMSVVSCKKKKVEEEEDHSSHWYSPTPGAHGTLPTSIMPDSLMGPVTTYFTINEGTNPTYPDSIFGQFVSRPHTLLHSTDPNDTISVFYDRYIAFKRNGNKIDFYGKQWDDELNNYYQEAYRGLYILGTGENFSCYYLVEGYPNGRYAKFSTIFSGKWNASYGGLKDFQVAVILLETSNNPHLAPAGTYRVLGDGDGLAQDTTWIAGTKGAFMNGVVTDDDPFRIFRVK